MSESFYTSVERYGKNMLFRGYRNGKPVSARIQFEPTLYIPTNEETEYKTLYGVPVKPYKPGNMKDCAQFVKDHEDISNFEIYGNTDYVAQFICQNFSDAEPDKNLINVVSFDMEVNSKNGFPEPDEAAENITAISARSSLEGVYHLWTIAEYDPEKTELTDIEIIYHLCRDEDEIIQGFMEFWTNRYPDIITGWNIENFDVPYLYNRMCKLYGQSTANQISPWGIVHGKDVFFAGKDQTIYNIKGIQNLDYLKVFRKFAYNYPPQGSYKLDSIAHVVLNMKKVDYDEYGSLHNLLEENPQLFCDYSIKDTYLVDQIDEKEDLINLIIELAYMGGVNFQDTFGSVKIWDTYIYKELLKTNLVIPKNEVHNKAGAIEGGHVKSPYTGMSHYVASFDLNSLYPHIIMQYNMSPETISGFVSGVKLDDLLDGKEYEFDREHECMAATGQLFRKDVKGLLPRIVEELYDQRKVHKNIAGEGKKRLESITDENEKHQLENDIAKAGNMQMAIKILMNSLYGAMSNQYFRYYDDRIAEGITVSGQLASRWAEKAVNQYLNATLGTDGYDFVIAIDTDSLYLRLEKLIEKAYSSPDLVSVHKKIDFLDKVCEKSIGPQIDHAYEKLQYLMSAPVQKMEMKREILADKGIWTRKKRYVLNVYDDEGLRYETPKRKVVGLESKRSDIPEVCRNMIEDTFGVIMEGSEKKTQDFILSKRDEFKQYPPEEIAFSKTASDVRKYATKNGIYKKGTPIHVRGALLYNKYLHELGLDNRFESIYDGDKVKYTYLKSPNPIKENVISFPEFLPKELDVRDYVDYDTQFDKAYLAPIQAILDVMNWSSETKGSLEEFFG